MGAGKVKKKMGWWRSREVERKIDGWRNGVKEHGWKLEERWIEKLIGGWRRGGKENGWLEER